MLTVRLTTALTALLMAGTTEAATYFVAPTGSDSNPGSETQPFATLQKGATVAVAGDTVYIRGGTYSITTPASSGAGIVISKSGTSDTNRIKFWAYNGEVPVFDFSKMTISTTGYTSGFDVSGSWLHFKGLEVCNVPMNTRSNTGFGMGGGHDNIIELMNFHHNNGSGFFISHGTGGHQIINCDSHDNYDPTSSQGAGQNSDGFGVHYQETGTSTTFRGCRAWWNSDDGWDFISQEVPVTVDNSWAMGSGYINSGTSKPGSGNGNGFKAGSSKTGIRHTVRNCVAWKNAAAGFYANHSSGGNTWYNNTSYNNGTQYNMLASTWDAAGVRTDGVILTGALAHIMRNNIGFPNDNTNMGGVDSAFNSWDLNITPANKDFLSVTDPSLETSGALGPRQADGSLPNVDFLKLVTGSQMIDKGTNVGLPFVGPAPDLGAYEFGASGTGGVTGSGGATGSGGMSGTGGTVTGGAVGTGGRIGSGGAVASGGAVVGSGGRSGTGGTPTGGSPSTGGVANAGGGVATGGAAAGTGGRAATGGTIATGGMSGTGGTSSTLSATGGTVGAGGIPSSAGGSSGNGTGGAPANPQSSSGCGCRLGSRPLASGLMQLLLVTGLLVVRRRRAKLRAR